MYVCVMRRSSCITFIIIYYAKVFIYTKLKNYYNLLLIDVFSNICNNVEPFHFFALLLESFHGHLWPPVV